MSRKRSKKCIEIENYPEVQDANTVLLKRGINIKSILEENEKLKSQQGEQCEDCTMKSIETLEDTIKELKEVLEQTVQCAKCRDCNGLEGDCIMSNHFPVKEE